MKVKKKRVKNKNKNKKLYNLTRKYNISLTYYGGKQSNINRDGVSASNIGGQKVILKTKGKEGTEIKHIALMRIH